MVHASMVSKALKTVKREPGSSSRSPLIPNPSPTHNPNSQKQSLPSDVSLPSPVTIRDDECLQTASHLERAEVLRRRSQRLRQLTSIYKRHYWTLIEDLRIKHRDYYWEFGKSPLEKRKVKGQEVSVEEEEVETGEERLKCAFSGCKAKAMPLTKFCHQHILADPKQTLYKPCNFVIKSSPQGSPITCGKPVLKAANPSLCHAHYQRSQKGISQALKKAGVTMPPSSSNKPIPKFSLLISEAVNQIQLKRQSANKSKDDEPKEQALG